MLIASRTGGVELAHADGTVRCHLVSSGVGIAAIIHHQGVVLGKGDAQLAIFLDGVELAGDGLSFNLRLQLLRALRQRRNQVRLSRRGHAEPGINGGHLRGVGNTRAHQCSGGQRK